MTPPATMLSIAPRDLRRALGEPISAQSKRAWLGLGLGLGLAWAWLGLGLGWAWGWGWAGRLGVGELTATRLQEGGEGAVDRVGEVGHEVAVEAHVSEKVERDEQVVDRLKAACLEPAPIDELGR